MRFSSFVAVAAVAGAAVAGYVYYKKYKKIHEELEKDFNEFEDIQDDPDAPADQACDPNGKYTSLDANKNEFVGAARSTLEAAKGMIPPAKNIAKDVAGIIQEKACDANVVAGDYYSAAKEKVSGAVANAKEKLRVVEENALANDTVDDVIIDIDVAGNITEEK